MNYANNVIDNFRGQFKWLSNFHRQPVEFKGDEFPTTENAYQAAKSSDPSVRKEFTSISPRAAKKRAGE